MKITISPSEPMDGYAGSDNSIPHSVTIEHPSDHVSLSHAITMVAMALKAYGYSSDGVDQLIEPV